MSRNLIGAFAQRKERKYFELCIIRRCRCKTSRNLLEEVFSVKEFKEFGTLTS